MKTAIFRAEVRSQSRSDPSQQSPSRPTPLSASSWPASAARTCGSTAASPTCPTAQSDTSSSASSTRSATTSRTSQLATSSSRHSRGATAPVRTAQAGFHSACVHGGVFGQDGEGDGGQAEFVRVPQADGTLFTVPARTSATRHGLLLALTDVMATGYHAAVSAEVKSGDTVAVVGDGAVGLCAVLSAKILGAERIIVLGSTTNPATRWPASGAQPTSSPPAMRRPFSSSRTSPTVTASTPSWNVSVANWQPTPPSPLPRPVLSSAASACRTTRPSTPLFRSSATSGHVADPLPARFYQPQLVDAVLKGEINPGKVFDLTTDLDHIAEGYAAMDERRAIKALVKVSALAGAS